MAEIRDARIVIIGGGVIGTSIAFHLARMGHGAEVVLLERAALTHGATWHAAGLVGQLRNSRNLTRMLQLSTALYEELAADADSGVDWHRVGSLRLASSPDRWLEIRRLATTAKSFGFELHLLDAAEAVKLCPIIDPAGVEGAAFIPSDGHVEPSSLTQALARGARRGGVGIVEGCTVHGFERSGRRITAVRTSLGQVRCEVVVNAAGMWARQLGALAGVAVPAAAVEHQYLVSEPVPGMPRDMPTLRDPDHLVYYKPEVGGLAVGGWEPDTRPFGDRRLYVPEDFGPELLASNFDRFAPLAELAAKRTPVLNEVGIKKLINGAIPVSADGEPLMGPAPELDNFYLACGFTAGIAAAGGAGQMLAEWITEGEPSLDLWTQDIRRFHALHASSAWLRQRTVEVYGHYYLLHYPGEELRSARPARRSPLYQALVARRAVHGAKFGWERPNWFAPEGVEPCDRPSFGRANWFEAVGEEHRAVRERVALIDQSSFAKLALTGRGALAALQRIAAADVDRPPGSIVYTQLCNERGGIEADVTIVRRAAQDFLVVTGSGFGTHDFGWIRRQLPDDDSVGTREVTSEFAVINLCGPRSREVLAQLAEQAVDNEALPYLQARPLTLGLAPVLALRVGYSGELGYELHVASEWALTLYESLREAGEPFGIADVGYRAIESLRLEKGYRYWSSDISPEYHPYEAGLGFCVALDKGEFIGRTALVRLREAPLKRRLRCLLLEDPVPVFGGEAVLRDGEVLGAATSAGYGYSVGRSIVLAWLPADAGPGDGYEVETFGERHAARVVARAPYDPRGERLRA